MSSELIFENSFFSDPFSPFTDSTTIDHHGILQTLPNNILVQDSPVDVDVDTYDTNNPFLIFLSSSPPNHQLENLSLCQNGATSSDSPIEYAELSSLEVKTEECLVDGPFHNCSSYGYSSNSSFELPPQSSCLGLASTNNNNAAKLMQRSFSSSSFDVKPDNYLFQPCFDTLLESPDFQNQIASSPESSSFSSNQMMRRVCSTGDLQKMKTATETRRNVLSSSPLTTEKSFTEDAATNKASRYSAEERKERIDRYRAKRTHRKFNKKIKYACRKTLADTRPRIRGRFARNKESGEISKTAMFNQYQFEDEEDLCWVEGFQGGGGGVENESSPPVVVVGRRRAPPFLNSFNAAQHYQYFSFS